MLGMDVNETIRCACRLDSEPLSEEPLDAIIKRYEGPDLVKKMHEPAADLDFGTKFIRKHEEFIPLGSNFPSVEINGGRLRCCHNLRKGTSASAEKEQLFVLLHGLGGNMEQFEPLMRLLDSEDKKFVAIDLPGFGKSDEWANYLMDNVVKAVHHTVILLFSMYQSYSKLTMVGHSAGCYILIHFLTNYQNSFQFGKCVLLAPPKRTVDVLSKENHLIQFGLKAISKIPWILDIYRERFDQNKGLASSGISRFFYRDGDITNKYRKLWQFHNNIQIKSRSLWNYLLGWQEINWSKVDSTLTTVSIVIMCGANDVVTPLSNAQDMLKCFTNAQDKNLIVIPECGHNLTFDYPELFLANFSQAVLSN